MSSQFPQTGRWMRGLSTAAHACGVVGSVLSWTPSFAQEATDTPTIQEVLVTAQKREENAKDVPVTVVALSGAQLEQQGLSSLNDYAKFIPGLIYNGTGGGERSGPDIVIRGVANSRLGDFETNIATATTGFSYGELPVYAFDPEIIDVQRIEVLEGPQGTLYGAAAMGGLVKVVPNLPNLTDFSATLQAGGSVLDSGWGANALGYEGAAVVNTPLSETLALRFSFHAKVDPGYINLRQLTGNPNDEYGPNVLVGFNSLQGNTYGAAGFDKNVNKSEASGGRVALRFKPNEQFDATLAFMYDAKQTDSLPNYEPVLAGSGSPRTAAQFQLQPQNTNYSIGSLEAAYDFGPVTLHSVTGWIDRRFSANTDFAGITYGSLGGNGVVPLPTATPLTFNVDTKILSQELRLTGEEKDLFWSGSGLDWTVGGFVQREQRDAFGDVTVGAQWLSEAQAPLISPPSGTTTVWSGQYASTYMDRALFGDLTFHVTPRLSFAGGLRFSNQSVSSTRIDFSDVFASAPPTGNSVIHEPVHEKKTTPRATANFALTDDINLYATYSEGFRIGGFNPIGNLSTPGCADALKKFGLNDPGSAAEFKSDTLKNYEIGIKTDLDGGRIIASLGGFREDWENLQTTINLAQYDNGCGASFVGNSGAARIYGAEGQLQAAVTEHLSVQVSGQYADAKIVKVVTGSSGTLGAPLESAPKTQFTAGVQYKLVPRAEWNAVARLDYAYVGARNFSNTNTPVDPAYQLPGYGELNLRVSVDHDNWTYTTYVNNLTDAIPQLGVYIYAGGPGDYSGAYAKGSQRFVTTSAPRTIGFSVKKNF
jgi:iron complex outermembrane recepter protein